MDANVGLTHALDELSAEWARLGVPVDDKLQPGLPRDTITDTLSAIFDTVPLDAIDWFAWHDGTKPGERWYAEPSRHSLLSLSAAIDHRSWLLGVLSDMFANDPDGFAPYKPEQYWNPNWLPMGDSDTPTTLALDLSSPSVGLIEVDWQDQDLTIRRSANQRRAAQLWVEGLRSGSYEWTGVDWQIDFRSMPETLRRRLYTD